MADPMRRIGMSTVNFRERFDSTRSKESTYTGSGLTLLEVPAYFADRFKLHKVEFWSRHFESIEPSYLKDLRKAINSQKSKLINIQFDENYQLADPDSGKRKESLELALRWVSVAKELGSGAIRVNPGKGDADLAIDALRTINKEAKKQGIVLMTENHFGMEMDMEVHLKIIESVGKNMYTLPDFGNYSDDIRYEALRKIMPFAYQVSAKTIDFDDQMNHISFDFDQCMQISVKSGFQGIYSVEQWSPRPVEASDEAIADWMIEKVKAYCM
jgi:sugar phosphate isomerase/epimerase